MDVAQRFAEGYSHKEIAKLLNISPATVRHHLSEIYATLGVHDKAQLARMMRPSRVATEFRGELNRRRNRRYL